MEPGSKMVEQIYRGVVRGGAVVFPEGAASPAEGTEVIVTPVVPERGTAASLRAALASAPPVKAEWMKELMQIIKEARTPVSYESPFGEEAGGSTETGDGNHNA
jgi:hypothetical protein